MEEDFTFGSVHDQSNNLTFEAHGQGKYIKTTKTRETVITEIKYVDPQFSSLISVF